MLAEEELRAGPIYPDLGKIRQISLSIAAAVCRLAWEAGLAQYAEPDDIREYVRDCMYHPEYRLLQQDTPPVEEALPRRVQREGVEGDDVQDVVDTVVCDQSPI